MSDLFDDIHCASTNGLIVLDIRDYGQPKFVSQVYIQQGPATGICLSGNYAYITGSNFPQGALAVIDISLPTQPRLESVTNLGSDAYDIVLKDNYAFVACRSGLKVVDLTTQSTPVVVAQNETKYPASEIQVSGDFIYIVAGYVYIFDITDPLHTFQVSEFDTPKYASGLIIKDTILYISDADPVTPAHWSALTLIDIADAADPSLISSYNFPGAIAAITVSSEHAYVSTSQGIVILETTNPLSLIEEGILAVPGPSNKLIIIDTCALISTVTESVEPEFSSFCDSCFCVGLSSDSAVRSGDFIFANIADKTNPCVIGKYPGQFPRLFCSSKSDEIIFVGDDFSSPGNSVDYPDSIFAIDAIVADSLTRIASLSFNTDVLAFTSYGEQLFVMCEDSGLMIYDFSNPYFPSRLGTFEFPEANAIDVEEGIAYIGSRISGVTVIDVADPRNPRFLSNYPEPTYDLEVVSGRVYLVGPSQISILSVVIPSSPELLGQYDMPGSAISVHNELLLVGYSGALNIFDVSDPTSLRFLTTLYIGMWLRDLETIDGFCFAADGRNGMAIINLSDPTNPVICGKCDTPGFTSSISVLSRYIFLADKSGLIRLQIQDPSDIPVEQPMYEGILPTFEIISLVPNPSNSSVKVSYIISRRCYLTVEVLNILGHNVATIIREEQKKGYYEVTWDGKSDSGFSLPSGLYFISLKSAETTVSKKFVLLK